MERQEIITKLKKYFSIDELVCKHTFSKWGERAWQFLDTDILETILVVRRDILQCGMVCNDYKFGGSHTQRGLRCNLCELVQDKTRSNENYLSAHCNGRGFDFVFNAKNMTAAHARDLIKSHASMLPYPVRIEKGKSWLHIDCFDSGNGQKVTEFNG